MSVFSRMSSLKKKERKRKLIEICELIFIHPDHEGQLIFRNGDGDEINQSA